MVLSFLIPYKRTLRPEDLLRSRGVAASGFRPLSNIPYCCHPQVYGPCFSSIVGDHPLRSPTRLRLGKPLPYQLADGPQAPPKVDFSFFCQVSNPRKIMRYCHSFPSGIPRFGAGHQRVTHPFATNVLLHPFDLHVLGTPPAFILSQDQTLR